MARRSLWTISNEDEDVLNNVDAETVVEVEDVVAAEEENAEFIEDVQEVEDDVVALEEAEEVASEMEEQIETNEQVLEEQPESITEETVAIAQEAFAFNVARLGYPIEHTMSMRVSQESAKSSPVQAFKLSTEGMKDFLVKVKDTIVKLFKKIGEMIKKINIKVSVLMDRTAKNAQSMAAKCKEQGNGNIKLDDETQKAIVEKLPNFIAALNGKVDAKAITDFIKFDVIGALYKNDVNKVQNISMTKSLATLHGVENAVPINAHKKAITYVKLVDKGTLEIVTEEPELKLEGIKVSGVNKYSEVYGVLTVLIGVASNTKAYVKQVESSQQAGLAMFNNLVKEAEANGDIQGRSQFNKQLSTIKAIGSRVTLDAIQQYVAVNKALLSICALVLKGGKAEADLNKPALEAPKKEENKK